MTIKNGVKINKVVAGQPGVALQVNSKGNLVRDLSESFSQSKIRDILLGMNPNLELVDYPGLGKQISLKDKVIVVCKNITFIGQNHEEDAFRIQLPSKYKDIYNYCVANNMTMLICGYYHYKDNQVWTIFNTDDYMSHKSVNNSAAWVYTWDIREATLKGRFSRVDSRNNRVETMDIKTFYNRLNNLINYNLEVEEVDYDEKIKEYISGFFNTMKKTWSGLDAYKEMIPTDFPHATQAAWEGWYLEFLLINYLKEHQTEDIIWWGKKGEGFTDLDLKFPKEEFFYGDTKSDNESKDVQGNKKETIDTVIESGGRIWYITCEFFPEMDKNHGLVVTKYWNEVRNKLDKNRNKPLTEYGSRMKYSVSIKGLDIYQIDSVTYSHLIEYAVSPVKGKPRAPKYKIGKKEKARFRVYHLDA